MPLLLRKSQRGIARGVELTHKSGRTLLLTDNSPANWSYMCAYGRQLLSLSEVRTALSEDRVPVAMVVDGQMKTGGGKKCCRVAGPSPNAKGWKVCHKVPVGMRGRMNVQERPIEALKKHFCTFMSPSNLFLVPLELGGLGEVAHFIDAINREPDHL